MIQTLRGMSSAQVVRRIGERARDLRLALARSQEDVARAAGLSRTTLTRFEAGKPVEFEAVVRIAIALEAEDELGALFPTQDPQSLDEILALKARPRRRGGRTIRPSPK